MPFPNPHGLAILSVCAAELNRQKRKIVIALPTGGTYNRLMSPERRRTYVDEGLIGETEHIPSF
jgi:hypothetical protein